MHIRKGGINLYYPYSNQAASKKERIITVTGVGQKTITPEIARIQLEVHTENMELTAAKAENDRLMNAVIQAIGTLGITSENIQTVRYNISPRYDYSDGKQIFRGYEVTNAIAVTVDNFDQIGPLIDLATQNGVNRVLGIVFTTENTSAYYNQALSQALMDGLMKAETIAQTMQFELDPTPVKITEQPQNTPVPYQTFATKQQSATTPIEPGQMIIRAVVEMQFRY